MRVRFALAIGSLLLAGGALTGGAVAFADAPPSVSQPAPQKTGAPTAAPGAPTAAPAPADRQTTAAPGARVATPGQLPKASGKRVPTAVPAGPTGDLHLPSVWG